MQQEESSLAESGKWPRGRHAFKNTAEVVVLSSTEVHEDDDHVEFKYSTDQGLFILRV